MPRPWTRSSKTSTRPPPVTKTARAIIYQSLTQRGQYAITLRQMTKLVRASSLCLPLVRGTQARVMEQRRRTIVKSLSWRFFATIITTLVAYGITGQLTFALEIGLLDTSIKLFMYYFHERVWLRVSFGRPPEQS